MKTRSELKQDIATAVARVQVVLELIRSHEASIASGEKVEWNTRLLGEYCIEEERLLVSLEDMRSDLQQVEMEYEYLNSLEVN